MTFQAPVIEWVALTPLFIVFGMAVVGVLLEAFLPRKIRRPLQISLSLIAVAAAIVVVIWRWQVVVTTGAHHVVNSSYLEDVPALAAQAILLLIALLSILVMADRTSLGESAFAAQVASRPGSFEEEISTRDGYSQTEIYPLTLFSLGGMMVFAAAGDILTLFVALEVLSLPLYVLTASARRRRLLSQEAALKYFMLGAFASAFFIFGAALLYGFSGSIEYSTIFNSVYSNVSFNWMLVTGVVMLLVGLLFKVGAVPFHSWTPDVYQGAPTPVTGYMAAATKLAAFAAIMRFVYAAVPGTGWDIMPVAWVIIILTMLVGTVMGLIQNNLKRMLAYSSIAHAGFVLIAVFSIDASATSAILFYILAYGVATVGAFAVLTLVREANTTNNPQAEATDINSWAGIGKRSPLLAVCMSIFLLSFAGIPLTAGFMGKLLVFSAGVRGSMTILVVLAVMASAATAFFYFRLIVLMFFNDPVDADVVVVGSEGTVLVAVVVSAVITVLLGILPGPIMNILTTQVAFLQ